MNAQVKKSYEHSQPQWNAGGWFGGALGSSAWMVIIACFLMGFGQTVLAVVPFACFAMTMMAAIVIWQQRIRQDFLSGIVSLIGVLAFTIPIAWLSTSIFANDVVRANMNWPDSPIVTAIVLFAAPAVGLWIVLVESRRQSN